MKINWENIKYLFQIPLGWFKSVSDRIFKAYGTNFIVVRDGVDGAMHIDVDEDNFNAAVSAAVSVDTSDCVKVVNGIFPDEQGWVNLGTILSGVDNVTNNDFGMLHLNAVRSVNTITCDSSTNFNVNIPIPNVWELETYQSNKLSPDLCGVVHLPNYVKTVNSIYPDSNGNVDISASGTVKSVNDISPDPNGNVDLGDIVYSVNGETAIDGEVTLDIESIVQTAIDNGDITIDGVKTVNSISPDGSGNVNLGDLVYSVDDVTPDAQGNVDFGLDASKWMKTDANGHIWYTNEIPVALSAGNQGYLYSDNGVLQFKDDQYVDLSSTQSVMGEKTWNSDQYFRSGTIAVQRVQGSGTGAILWQDSGGDVGLNLVGAAGAGIVMTNGNQSNTIMKSAAFGTTIQDSQAVILNSTANYAMLTNEPDSNAGRQSIATVGWCKDNCLSAPAGEQLQTTTLSCCSEVKWDGTYLTYRCSTLRFSNGLLVEVGNSTLVTVDTPVAYSP